PVISQFLTVVGCRLSVARAAQNYLTWRIASLALSSIEKVEALEGSSMRKPDNQQPSTDQSRMICVSSASTEGRICTAEGARTLTCLLLPAFFSIEPWTASPFTCLVMSTASTLYWPS